jgi:succinoglycan biosynthesis protein ExoM
VLGAEHGRTGNVLFHKRILGGELSPFDPRFGRTGGEDGDFFRRMTGKGQEFVWCNEAPVYETVTPERLKRIYFVKRAILRGVSEVEFGRPSVAAIVRSVVAAALYSSALPFFLVSRHDLFMKYLVKDCDHVSKLLASCGIRILTKRDF